MATGEVRNIIVGAAGVYIATDADKVTDLPAGAKSASGATARTALDGSADWRSVGFTMEGVEVSYEPSYSDVEVDQLLDSALTFKDSMRVTVNTTFAEATLENLLIVWGQKASSLASGVLSIEAGELGDYPLERSIAFVGPGVRTTTGNGNETAITRRERVYHLARAIQTESSSFALRRSEATGLPTSFRLLPDATQSTPRYGTIRDRAIT